MNFRPKIALALLFYMFFAGIQKFRAATSITIFEVSCPYILVFRIIIIIFWLCGKLGKGMRPFNNYWFIFLWFMFLD